MVSLIFPFEIYDSVAPQFYNIIILEFYIIFHLKYFWAGKYWLDVI